MSTTTTTDTGDTNIISSSSTTTSSSSTTMDVGADEAVVAMLPRESLITTAVSFLQNDKVRYTTLMQKQQFLRSKGLTMEEIQLACERAGVFSQDPNKSTVINMGTHSSSTQMALMPQKNAFERAKDILHAMTLMSGVAYAVYIFFKKFIQPFLFGRKKKPVEEALETMEKKVETRIDGVNHELTRIKETLVQQTEEQTRQMNREFSQFRSDLEAIKGLLLNRKQFASPLSGVPASIPAWQLASSPHHRHRHSQSDDNEKGDDAGSGSGSSETEVVTKNSDSSLEIM